MDRLADSKLRGWVVWRRRFWAAEARIAADNNSSSRDSMAVAVAAVTAVAADLDSWVWMPTSYLEKYMLTCVYSESLQCVM